MLNYVNPANFTTPLVEIHQDLNPYYSDGVRFFAKLLQFSPLANVKSIPAYEMLSQAKIHGQLDCKDIIVEASSGNTSYGLSVLSRLLSINNIEAYVSHEISIKKLNMLRLFGIKPTVFEDPLCADATDPNSRIYKARDVGKEKNIYNPGQYSNYNNLSAHYKYTAEQIWDQTEGEINIFCTGLGTSGTFSGCSKFFKQKNSSIRCVAGLRSENNMVPGLRTKNQMREIDFPWKEYMDSSIKIGSVDSYQNSVNLIRYGIIAGPSSGLAFATAKKYIEQLKEVNKLSVMKNERDQINVVFICCDFPYLYLDEYFQQLDQSNFPEVKNEHLLQITDGLHSAKRGVAANIQELEPREVFKLVFDNNVSEVWKKLEVDSNYSPQSSFLIVDLRSPNHYEEHHIPGAVNVLFDDLDSFLANDDCLKNYQSIIFVCGYGKASRLACQKAMTYGVDAISMAGGDTEWSRLNLPRRKAESCARF